MCGESHGGRDIRFQGLSVATPVACEEQKLGQSRNEMHGRGRARSTDSA